MCAKPLLYSPLQQDINPIELLIFITLGNGIHFAYKYLNFRYQKGLLILNKTEVLDERTGLCWYIYLRVYFATGVCPAKNGVLHLNERCLSGDRQ